MKTAALMVCKGFLDRCPKEMQDGLIQLLPQRERLNLQELSPLIPLKAEQLTWDLLENVHHSWIAPFLRTLTENEVRLFLSSLSKQQANELEKVLGFSDNLFQLSKLGKKSLRKILLEQVKQNQELVPVAFLPDHPLNFLIETQQETFVKIIRFWGLHDLSVEMRQIIDTAVLKKIFSALPKRDGEYLNTLLLHREPLIFKRLFLEKWDGSKKQMLKAIEERGLHRLAHALYNANPSLTWYLTRKLDMHLGTRVLKYEEKPSHARAEKILTDQIHKILTFISHEESV